MSVTPWYTTAFGVSLTREEVKNTYISDDNFNPFPLRRDDAGIYWENRFQVGSRFFINAGVRGEIIRTPFIPENTCDGRPAFPANTISKVNPKVALTYVLRADAGLAGTRLHSSFGTGIRPPAGLELAFTNNPALKPERTASFDVGVEQRLFERPAVARCDLFLQPLLRSDRLSGRRSGGAELIPDRQPVERTRAGRGIVRPFPSGALDVADRILHVPGFRDPLVEWLDGPGAAVL